MFSRVTLVYNAPEPSRYDTTGEVKAVLGVLDAVQAVEQSLLELGYSVTLLPLSLPLEEAREKLKALDTDLVFNLFEGFCGFPETEALVPETLSELGIPFTGCQGGMIRLSLNKAGVKVFLKAADIPSPDAQVLTPQTVDAFQLDYPCIVKPCGEDASHGLTGESVVNDFVSLERQVRVVSESYGGSALVEKFIDGREFNATVMGKSGYSVLPISEIVYSLPPEMPRILTFAAKWEPDSPYFHATKAVCPAKIKPAEKERIAATALAVFRLLGCKSYARVDMRVDRQGRINVIEVNPNPDISPGTGAARQAAAAGMTYTEFVGKIIEIALEKESNGTERPADAKEGQTGPDADFEDYPRVQAV
ncbi:MAG: ATP-grasp domain-containing protein [Chloroflexi bacterium]|nr:ATP-grasp domain-containing protein [Chloroflexota bacterium]